MSVEQVGEWLRAEGLAQFADAFVEDEVNGEMLADIQPSDLEEFGIGTASDRKNLIARVTNALRCEGMGSEVGAASPTVAAVKPAENSAEAAGSSEAGFVRVNLRSNESAGSEIRVREALATLVAMQVDAALRAGTPAEALAEALRGPGLDANVPAFFKTVAERL
jgi:hypothetical protein